jgi:hypothetical protein
MTSPIGLPSTKAAKTYPARALSRDGAARPVERTTTSPRHDEVHRVLEMEKRVRVPERRVVGLGEVPDHVVREPEGEGNRGVCEHADRRRPSSDRCKGRGSPSTTRSGAHSASTTFCRRCIVRRKCIPSVWMGVTATATRSTTAPTTQAIRQAGAG